MADSEQVREIWIDAAAGWAEFVCFLYADEVFSGKVVELRLFLGKLARAKSRTGYQVPNPKS
jgi:hypothetical protein